MRKRLAVAATLAVAVAPAPATAKSPRNLYVGIRAEAKERDYRVGPDLRAGVRSPSGKMVRAKARHYAEAYRDIRARMRGWVIPAYIVMCESGGNNLPPNSAGASGYYQIIPGTWAAFGGLAYAPQAYLASKWAQDKVALRIWADGAHHWVCA